MAEPVPSIGQSPADALAARLDDPATAASLNALLDHADLLAMVVTGLSEFVGRGDTLTDTIREAIGEMKGAGNPAAGLGIDVSALSDLAKRGGELAPKLAEKLPVLEQALEPGPNGVDVIDVAAMVARAVSEGTGTAEAGDLKVKGVFALLKALKDDDVSRAIGFGLSIAKALGEQLRVAEAAASRPQPHPAPQHSA